LPRAEGVVPQPQLGHRQADTFAVLGVRQREGIERDLGRDVPVDPVAFWLAAVHLTVALGESRAFALKVAGGQTAQGDEDATVEHLRAGGGDEGALVTARRDDERGGRRQRLQQLARDVASVVLRGASVIDHVGA
jgi:hypothetical protein